MKHFKHKTTSLFFILLILQTFFIVPVFSFGVGAPNRHKIINLKLGNKYLKIHFGDNIIYTIKKKYSESPYYKGKMLLEFDSEEVIENKYIKLNGKTKIIKFSSNKPNILKIDDKGIFDINNTGNAIIKISVDNNFINIPIKIICFNLEPYSPKDKVIELLGLPDKKHNKYISWPDSGFLDDIWYDTDNSPNGTIAEHWIYNKYPKAIFRFGGGVIEDCVMTSWEDLRLNYKF